MNGPISKAVSSALARVYSGRSAILKIVEEKALGTRLLFLCLVQNSIGRVENLLLTVEGTTSNYDCNMAKQSAMIYL